MGGYAPRAREDSVRPRRLVGASGRPLNFIVSWTGKSAMQTRSQQFKLATAVPNAGDPESKIHATTKPQRAVQASLERTRMRLRFRQQFSPGAPGTGAPFRHLKGCTPVATSEAVQLTSRCSERPAAVAELLR